MAEWLRQGPAKPCTRVRFPLPPRAISSAGERFPDTEEVTGSIPVSPTMVYLQGLLVPPGAHWRGPGLLCAIFALALSLPHARCRCRSLAVWPCTFGSPSDMAAML